MRPARPVTSEFGSGTDVVTIPSTPIETSQFTPVVPSIVDNGTKFRPKNALLM